MASFLALVIASLAGWLVEGSVRPMLGSVLSMGASLVVSGAAFFFAKQFLSDLRGGS
jgi:hypothetical protein